MLSSLLRRTNSCSCQVFQLSIRENRGSIVPRLGGTEVARDLPRYSNAINIEVDGLAPDTLDEDLTIFPIFIRRGEAQDKTLGFILFGRVDLLDNHDALRNPMVGLAR